MKKQILGFLGVMVILAVFYQQILLVGCQLALHCFLPKTFSYQKIAWDKNVLRLQGLIKEKNELSIDSIDIFYQDGSFHIRIVHPQCLLATAQSQSALGILLGLNRFFSMEMQHGVLELNQLRYYFSLLPKTEKELEFKLAMDPDPLYPALLTLHYSPSNQINLSVISQELKHLLPIAHLWGYFDKKGLDCQAEVSVEANGVIHPTGYIQDLRLKTIFTKVEIQHENKQWRCDQIEAELCAAKVHVKDLWHSCRGNLHLQNGSYALLSKELEWQNNLLHIDLIITEQPKGFLSAVAVDGKNSFPFILETTCIDRYQQGIRIQAAFSDLTGDSIQGNLVCQIGKESVIECDIQKFKSRHLNWAMFCFALPPIKSSISYEWESCSARIETLFLDSRLQSVILSHLQAKELSVCSASDTFVIKNAQVAGKWSASEHRITEGYCQLEKAQGLDVKIEYPGEEDAICARVQGDLSIALDCPLYSIPLITDFVIRGSKLHAAGTVLNVPFLAEAMLVTPLFSLENLGLSQGYIKLKEITEEQYKPWLTRFVPDLIIKGKYQLECLFDTDKIVIGVEGEEIQVEHLCKKIEIPKLSELFFQCQEGKWGLYCPRLEGSLNYKEDIYSFHATLNGVYPQLNIQDLSLVNKDVVIKAAINARYQDVLNLKLQVTEIELQNKKLEGPILAEINVHPESTVDKIVADLKSLSMPISSKFTLEEGIAQLELDSHINKLYLTQGSAKICYDKEACYDLQIDSLIVDNVLADVHFTGSLQIEEMSILQIEGTFYNPRVANWRVDCNLHLPNSEIEQLQLSLENTFEKYHFSCLGKDISISGQKISADWQIDQMQVGPLTATAVFTADKNQFYCKSIKGSYEKYPFLASGVFDWQTHAICGQVDFDTIVVKSAPFICEYSVDRGFFSKQIDLTVEDLKSSDILAHLFCHSTSYRGKDFESTIDFSLPAFHSITIPVAWDVDVIGRLEIKKTSGCMQISGDVKPGDLMVQQLPIQYQNATFSLENNHFMLNSELNLGNKPFWAALELECNRSGVLTLSEQALQTGLKSYFSIESNKYKISTIKGKACGITADLEAKDTSHLSGTVQIDVANCAAFIPFVEKMIQPLEFEASFIYQGEISKEGCTGFLQADRLEIKGFSIEKFSAGIDLSQKEIQIYDCRLSDQSGSLFAKTIYCKNLNNWEFWIPEIEIDNLHLDHVLKKAKPFVIEGIITDVQAQLFDLQTLHALGRCKFQYPQKNHSFFEVPLEILSKIGLDLHSFTPIEGELEFKIQQNRCYLTRLTKAFSKNGHCQFALSKKKEHASYIGLDGSLSVDLQLKQKKLLKIIDPFTFTIRGTLDKPKYSLVLLKN